MTPQEVSQALHMALADMLDCAASAEERELLIGFALNMIEQCQQRYWCETFSGQIEKMREQFDVTLPSARLGRASVAVEPTPALV